MARWVTTVSRSTGKARKVGEATSGGGRPSGDWRGCGEVRKTRRHGKRVPPWLAHCHHSGRSVTTRRPWDNA